MCPILLLTTTLRPLSNPPTKILRPCPAKTRVRSRFAGQSDPVPLNFGAVVEVLNFATHVVSPCQLKYDAKQRCVQPRSRGSGPSRAQALVAQGQLS